LLVDEVHKLKKLVKTIKIIYDGFPDLSYFFSSSALDLSWKLIESAGNYAPTKRLIVSIFKIFKIDIEPFTINELIEKPFRNSEGTVSKKYDLAAFQRVFKKLAISLYEGLTVASMTSRLTTILEVLTEDMAYVQWVILRMIFQTEKSYSVISETVPFTKMSLLIANI
jgi:hypothetical protein